MVEEVKSKKEDVVKAVEPVRKWTPPVSAPAPRYDPDKQKIASKLIEAVGDKLVELNYIMPGMLLDLIALDVLGFLQSHPSSTGDEILDYFRQSIYHHLRGHKGAFIRSVVDLAKEEYKINQSDGTSNINLM